MASEQTSEALRDVRLRHYQSGDAPAVQHLYTHGLLEGQIDSNDSGADIDNIEDAYFAAPHTGFWVAEHDGEILGTIGVLGDRDHVAEIRRLRADPAWQATALPGQLLETALAHCKHHGFLKVVLDTRFDSEAAVALFKSFGFQHHRTRTMRGKNLLEFYLNLYREREISNRG
jgi:N-acetylglutamate synthase-like GNAT family acetyltransferase